MFPNRLRRLRILWINCGSLAMATPAIMSLKPERYLVAEYRHRSAPRVSGCWNTGPRKVLSTITTGRDGWRLAVSAARWMSVIIMVGLAGVSIITIQGSLADRIAASRASPQPPVTG